MGSVLDWAADQEQDNYEKEHGKNDRECDRRLSTLNKMKSGRFTVNELQFLLDPHGKYSLRWGVGSTKTKTLQAIWKRVNG